ncbi:helix-turn-helix domain-containing protein [Streptomyces sp. NPDC051567]|uniref:helix-turn-helix domain-containing protein n=1 Tax=Streptomyces sp. NPDC051567 TaxID=3365660 RepID=UPI0037AB7FC9
MSRPSKDLGQPSSIEEAIGKAVQRARLSLGMSQRDLGALLHVGPGRIGHIETGVTPPTLGQIHQLDDALKLNGALTDLIPFLSRKQYPDWSADFVKLQAGAEVIKGFSLIIPGLLQTRDYARTLLEAGYRVTGEGNVDQRVDARVERQQILHSDEPPMLWVILAEAALRQVIGSGPLMAAQLAHVLGLADRGKIHVQVLTFARTEPAVTMGNFSLLLMPDGKRYAYAEGHFMGKLMEDEEEVTARHVLYDRLQKRALDPAASAALINTVMKEYER